MFPVQITIKDTPSSVFLESHIQDKVEKLNQFVNKINSCRVVVGLAQKHKRQGKLFSVHIDLTVPGRELVVNHKVDEDIYVAIRDAFNALERQLEKYVARRKGLVKHHEITSKGYISRIVPDEGYGFIQGLDGDEYYFSASNVANPRFETMQVGDIVCFIVSAANEGLQANRVTREKTIPIFEQQMGY